MSVLFGIDRNQRAVHISEATRGLSCGCSCIVCSEPLVARLGNVREHHFAHASGRDPCVSSYESILHHYAKRVIQDSGAVMVPTHESLHETLGLDEPRDPPADEKTGGDGERAWTRLDLANVATEVSFRDLRLDILAATPDGVLVAIEVAYSSFCDSAKIARFAEWGLPALEIDLRRFDPSNFDSLEVQKAVVDRFGSKKWLWPSPPAQNQRAVHAVQDALPSSSTVASCAEINPPPPRRHLPEEICTFSGRWVSIKQFDSGEIAIKAVSYDPDLVRLIGGVARRHSAWYNKKYHSWLFSKHRAQQAREEIKRLADVTQIGVAQKKLDG